MDSWITDWERGEPDWMPYYTRANAGETLPDPASPLGWVARELGIPCVVSVQDAASRIPDGALVTVDGTAGTVTVMTPSADDRVAAS